MVHVVTDKTFKTEVLENETPVLVDFWAPWCGPCRMVAPVVEQVEKTFQGKLKVCKIDTEVNSAASMEHQITSIPCLILFKNGKEIERLVGYRPANVLEQDIRKVIGA